MVGFCCFVELDVFCCIYVLAFESMINQLVYVLTRKHEARLIPNLTRATPCFGYELSLLVCFVFRMIEEQFFFLGGAAGVWKGFNLQCWMFFMLQAAGDRDGNCC